MNEQVKVMWCEALRSGKYVQTSGMLKREDCYCVIGVLVDLHSKIHQSSWTRKNGCYTYLRHAVSIPDEVQKWANLNCKDVNKLMNRNDTCGHSFLKLADYIHNHL